MQEKLESAANNYSFPVLVVNYHSLALFSAFSCNVSLSVMLEINSFISSFGANFLLRIKVTSASGGELVAFQS